MSLAISVGSRSNARRKAKAADRDLEDLRGKLPKEVTVEGTVREGIPHMQILECAQELGVDLTPDPFPEEVVFVRSDQYAFIRQGIPAVYMDGGVHLRGGGEDEGQAPATPYVSSGFIRGNHDRFVVIQGTGTDGLGVPTYATDNGSGKCGQGGASL